MECCEDENTVPIMSQLGGIDHRKDIEEILPVASKFCHYYYEMLEKKPHLVGQLYLEHSVLQWDGNPVVTRDGIQKFLEQLPSLTFKLMSMDCQALSSIAVGSKKSFIIKTAGQFRVSGVGTVKPFTQQIVLTADGDKWRIASDTFRSQN